VIVNAMASEVLLVEPVRGLVVVAPVVEEAQGLCRTDSGRI